MTLLEDMLAEAAASEYGALPYAASESSQGARWLDVIKKLLDAGYPVDRPCGKTGSTALQWASSTGSAAAVSLLLESGAAVNKKRSRDGAPPLICAVRGPIRGPWATHREVVKRLLDAGAEVDATNTAGRTALALAAAGGHLEIVVLLLDRGAQIDAGGALKMALKRDRAAVARLLVERGADVTVVDAAKLAELLVKDAQEREAKLQEELAAAKRRRTDKGQQQQQQQGASKGEGEGAGSQCVVCWTAARQVLFQPCNHVAVCTICSDKLRESQEPCPYCRAPIQRRLTVVCP